MQNHSSNDHGKKPAQAQIDLALLFKTELHVGSLPFYKQRARRSSLDMIYEIDGIFNRRSYMSPLSWRATIMFALNGSKTVNFLEIDRPVRYQRLFPRTLMRRLCWHARPNADFPPVAHLYDQNRQYVMLLTRSRLCDHAVDALHNLTEGMPVFQPLWIADIMALRPMLDIEFVRDETFSATTPIGAYLEAAAMTGRIVEEPELRSLPLIGGVHRLAIPPSSEVVRRIFWQECRENPALSNLRDRSIYEDYSST